MVSLYHMGDQPTSFPEEFDLSEDSEEVEIEYVGRALRVQEERVKKESVQEQEFWIGDESDEDDGTDQDALYQWYDQCEQEHYVRTVGMEKTKEIEIVLDSEADISLAPLWMKRYGQLQIRGSSR